MVYFRCTSSGSGKGNTVIVTCAEQFAGVAITIAKIGKSYTKVCPLTAPYVVKFYGVEAGTYTVSATVSGQTYSAEVVVQDVSCVLDYGFTWKTWVDTASQLDSTDYASLSEVLADEEAVRELFTEHACVDYMADSTSSNADLETIIENDLCAKWINNRDYALDFLEANTVIKALMDEADKYGYGEWVVVDDTTTPPTYGAKGNVPVMTANNAPYGEVSTNVTAASNYPAWKVFDGDDSTAFRTSSSVSTASITYKFVNPINVRRFKYFVEYSNTPSVTFQMAYSDDGTNFSNAGNAISDTVGQTARYHNIGDYGYHLYWKLTITFVGDSKVGICQTLQFYGRELWKQENSHYVPDYSEKEFEVGTTKKWLYDHGVELESISTNGNASKEESYILLDNTVSGTDASAGTTSDIDLTTYNLFRIKIGHIYRKTSSSGASKSDMRVSANSGFGSPTAKREFTDDLLPYHEYLDISTIDQSLYCAVTSGASSLTDSIVSFTELWLE